MDFVAIVMHLSRIGIYALESLPFITVLNGGFEIICSQVPSNGLYLKKSRPNEISAQSLGSGMAS